MTPRSVKTSGLPIGVCAVGCLACCAAAAPSTTPAVRIARLHPQLLSRILRRRERTGQGRHSYFVQGSPWLCIMAPTNSTHPDLHPSKAPSIRVPGEDLRPSPRFNIFRSGLPYLGQAHLGTESRAVAGGAQISVDTFSVFRSMNKSRWPARRSIRAIWTIYMLSGESWSPPLKLAGSTTPRPHGQARRES